jgi:hypothetical protein
MTSDAPAPLALRSAFCRFCQKDRFKEEMKVVTGPSGRKVKRCIHCIQYTAPQLQPPPRS